MTTYATMRARIADDLLDDGALTTAQINAAILTSIKYYEREGWWFNQATGSFSTVANQELYTSSDMAAIPNIVRIDLASVTVNSVKTRLRIVQNANIEEIQDGSVTGEPHQLARYADSLRLYPIPNAVYTISLSYIQKLTALSADSDSNAWTDECEELIRNAAKRRIALDVLKDPEGADAAGILEREAYDRLRSENRDRMGATPARVNWPFNRSYSNLETSLP